MTDATITSFRYRCEQKNTYDVKQYINVPNLIYSQHNVYILTMLTIVSVIREECSCSIVFSSVHFHLDSIGHAFTHTCTHDTRRRILLRFIIRIDDITANVRSILHRHDNTNHAIILLCHCY